MYDLAENLSELLEVGINVKSRNPLLKNTGFCVEWDSKDVGVLCVHDRL